MTDIIKFVEIEGYKALFDLGCGYLGEEKIGTYDGIVPIYSAEAFLNTIEEKIYFGDSVSVRSVTLPEQKVWRNKKYV